MDTYDDNNEITLDISIDEIESIPVTVDVNVEWDEPDPPGKLDKLKGAASFIGSKAKAIKDADIFKSLDKLQAESPGYSFLLYKSVHQSRVIRKTMSKTYYFPVAGYYFYSPEKVLKCSAEVAELKKQNIQILSDGITISEIRENSFVMRHSSFTVIVNGRVCGELKRVSKKKGVEVFTFNNWTIREKWTGNLEICTPDNKVVASWNKAGVRKIIKYWHEESELLIITLLTAINAYHNSEYRRHNHGRPYEVFHDSH